MRFNVWIYHAENKNLTGGWEYLCTVTAQTENIALDIVKARGYKDALKAYPHIDNF